MTSYEELRARALQMQADTYRASAEAEAASPHPYSAGESARLLHLAGQYDRMAGDYRSMIPAAQEGNPQ